MRIGRFELGISRDSEGKVAPFEMSLIRGPCECRIYNIGWFYFTILYGNCRR